jgi:lycopene cyclase domain-containing protein
LNSHYTYHVILACSIAGPLALSFDKKVAFYKNWKYVFAAMILPAIFYIVWDIFFTKLQVWQFNEKYIVGPQWFGLPIEEWLFFILIPYCCTFVYACVRAYFPNVQHKKWADYFLLTLAVAVIITGFIFKEKIYTHFTCIFLSAGIFLLYVFKKYFKTFDAASFLLSFALSLIPYFIVNGFLTALPILTYDDAENLGIRIYTIPFEDAFYGMLLLLMNIVLYEKFKNG